MKAKATDPVKPKTPPPFARGFWELVANQRARELQRQVFGLSRKFPREETYSLTDQTRRAARSIGAQIAEAWGKRDYERHFVSKLSDALGECNETQHWIISAADDGYLTRDEGKPVWNLCLEIGRLLASMTGRSNEFCQNSTTPVLREPSPDFFCSAPPPFPEEATYSPRTTNY